MCGIWLPLLLLLGSFARGQINPQILPVNPPPQVNPALAIPVRSPTETGPEKTPAVQGQIDSTIPITEKKDALRLTVGLLLTKPLEDKIDNQIERQNASDQETNVHLQRIEDLLDEESMSYAIDCSNFFRTGEQVSGVYKIKTQSRRLPFRVYCDLTTDGGGWTLIQRRGDFGTPVESFSRNWTEYKNGFGDLNKEFWLGNEQIYSVVLQGPYSLMINMIDYNNLLYKAQYTDFAIDKEDAGYALKVKGFSGNVKEDSLAYSDQMKFSTYDMDNDLSTENCAVTRHGGWWYKDCANANLNGRRVPQSKNNTLTWYIDGKGHVPIKSSEMKIRPKNF